MILLSYATDDGPRLGVKTDRGVFATGMDPDVLFRHGSAALPTLERALRRAEDDPGTAWLDEAGLDLGPPVPRPGKILCVGLNYRKHAAESGMAEPEHPVLFSKFDTSLAGPGDPVPLPAHAEQYDYEAELVAVIGRRAKSVGVDEALSCVMGYCNGNDVSARDLQFRSGQWLLGKTLDAFMPIGPYLVTADEAGDPQAMRLRLWLNGELRQDQTTADMIFSVAECVSYASRYMTLRPGDLVSTGTPEGVIFGREPKVWMKPGDETVVEIGPLGRLANRMVAG